MRQHRRSYEQRGSDAAAQPAAGALGSARGGALAAVLVAACALAWWAAPGPRASAVSTRSFVLDDAESFAKGELDGTMADSRGFVTGSASTTKIALPDDVALAYSLVRGPGGRFYVGTGNDGRVYALHQGKVSLFAETGQLLVAALAMGPKGVVYAGTLPDGTVRELTPRADKAAERVLTKLPGAEDVWSLVYDARARALFAATGPEGKVFRIDPRSGEAKVALDSDSTHVMSLALGSDGTLYAGTSAPGRVYALGGRGESATRPRVVADYPDDEVTALAARDGVLIVAANHFPEPPPTSDSSSDGGKVEQAQRPGPGEGTLYRILPDGRAEAILSIDDDHFTAVQIAQDGVVYAATGAKGRIERVDPGAHLSATWVDVDERQILSLGLLGDPAIFGTGDGAALYRVRIEKPTSARWTSEALDAKFDARWGRLAWRAEGKVAFRTRSGNTKSPDEFWSPWSKPMDAPGLVQSPRGRYVQVQADFSRDPSAKLLGVELFYLPQNQRAVVTDIHVKPPKKPSASKSDDATADAPPAQGATLDLVWNVDNPDGDTVRYRLRFRGEREDRFRPILRDSEILTEPKYAWDTSGLPDGWYIVQVDASDELSNPHGLELHTFAQSEPIRVDNTPPSVVDLSVRRGHVLGRAVDRLGPVARLQYAVDGGDWHDFFPVDGLLDSASERFDLEPRGVDAPGPHIVSIRATDAAGHVGAGDVTLETSRR